MDTSRRLHPTILVGLLLATATVSAAETVSGEFGRSIQLAPFVVQGKQLTISVHARSKGDRRYAEAFAEGVVKVVYEAVTEETGKGLVIIGRKGEPHPVFVFRKFLALAEAGKLDPAIAARGPELDASLQHWQHRMKVEESDSTDKSEGVDFEFEQILTALPLPLEGIGAKLYQLAWRENFDEAKVEAALRALRPADLEGNLFARFDWVFYLPARGAFEQVIDDIIAQALKEDDVGFFARAAVKTVLVLVKPKIRKAIEAMRRGVLFETVVQADTDLSRQDVASLTQVYVEQNMPDFDEKRAAGPGTEHERSVRAVREKREALAARPAPAAVDQPAATAEPIADPGAVDEK